MKKPAAQVVLVIAEPKDKNGQVQNVHLAGGGDQWPYHYFNTTNWKGRITSLPVISSRLGVDQNGWGASPAASGWDVPLALSQKTAKALLNLVWHKARVRIYVGAEGPADATTNAGLTLVMDGQAADFVGQGRGNYTLRLSDPTEGLTQPLIKEVFNGTGGLDGPPELKGRIRRRAWGQVFNLEAWLMDKAANIWGVTDPNYPLEAIVAVRDRGYPYDTLQIIPAQATAEATLSLLRSASVPQGGCLVAPSIGCIRPWTTPGLLTADVKGERGDGYVETRGLLATRFLALGGLTLGLSQAAQTYLTTQGQARVGVVADTNTSIAALLDTLFAPLGEWWRLEIDAGVNALAVGRYDFDAPPVNTTPLRAISVARTASLPATYLCKLGYQVNQKIHGEGELAQALTIAAQDIPGLGPLATSSLTPGDISTIGSRADEALAATLAIADDAVLDKGEKARIVRDYDQLGRERQAARARAQDFGLIGPLGLEQSAFDALTGYLASLPNGWNNTATNTPIVRDTFTQRWNEAWAKLAELVSATTQEAGRRASWSNITGAGKPQHYIIAAVGANAVDYPRLAGLYRSDGAMISQLNARSYTIVTSTDGINWQSRSFDVFGAGAIKYTGTLPSENDAGAMAAYLNGLTIGTIVVVYTFDEPRANRLSGGLPQAMYRCGASRVSFGSASWVFRPAYVLIGQAGIGEGNGRELYAGTADAHPNSWIQTSFTITNGVVEVGGASLKDARDLAYTDGTPINDLRPAQAGATVGATSDQVAQISAAQSAATAAQSAASSAQSNAQSALSQISNIVADSVLDRSEKPEIIARYNALVTEQASLDAQANSYGLTPERNAYSTALSALSSYLAGLSPAWSNTGADTAIDRATFNARFQSVYTARQAVVNGIANEAAKRANWANVSGAGRPQDNATVGAPAGTQVGGVEAGALARDVQLSSKYALYESFAGYDSINQVLRNWWAGSSPGEVILIFTSDGGGKALRLGNNSGNDAVDITTTTNLPYTPADLWVVEIDLEIEQNPDGAVIYLGVHAEDAQGNNLSSDGGTFVYVAATGYNAPAGDRRIYRGYFRGYAAVGAGNAVGIATPNPDRPGAMPNGTVFVRPRIIVNYANKPGQVVLHSVTLRRVEDAQGAGVPLITTGSVQARGATITKFGGAGAWDSQAYSPVGYTGGAYVSFKANQTDKHFMIGLNSDPATDASFFSIDYAWYVTDVNVHLYESGAGIANFGSYSRDTIFTIVYDGVHVYYYKDGVENRKVAAPRNLKLHLDSSFHSPGASAQIISYGPYGSSDWARIGGAGRPQDNATVGATWGQNLYSVPGELTDGRIGAAIGSGGVINSGRVQTSSIIANGVTKVTAASFNSYQFIIDYGGEATPISFNFSKENDSDIIVNFNVSTLNNAVNRMSSLGYVVIYAGSFYQQYYTIGYNYNSQPTSSSIIVKNLPAGTHNARMYIHIDPNDQSLRITDAFLSCTELKR